MCEQVGFLLRQSHIIVEIDQVIILKEKSHTNKQVYYNLSLGALVPNSRDRHEKQWRPDFTHHKTHPKMHFVCEK